jgi:Mrp family chromosome partitioning ATPase
MRWDLSAALLDCDLRRPSVETLMRWEDRGAIGPDGELGRPDEMTRQLIVDRRSGLHILPLKKKTGGPQLLSASLLRSLLQRMREKYDLILLDMPPVLAVADALAGAALADGVVLVVDCQRTPRRAFSDAVQMLRRNGALIAGTVLSKGELPKYAQAYGGVPTLADDGPKRPILAASR